MIRFFTNLDHGKRFADGLRETWRGPVPCAGQRIAFRVGPSFRFELEVVMVTYSEAGDAEVELHVPSHWHGKSIADWEEFMGRHGVRR